MKILIALLLSQSIVTYAADMSRRAQCINMLEIISRISYDRGVMNQRIVIEERERERELHPEDVDVEFREDLIERTRDFVRYKQKIISRCFSNYKKIKKRPRRGGYLKSSTGKLLY